METTVAATVLRKARKLLDKSGMTMDELGVKMGFAPGTARRAVWQLFNKTDDPRLSTVVRLAEALGVEVKDLL